MKVEIRKQNRENLGIVVQYAKTSDEFNTLAVGKSWDFYLCTGSRFKVDRELPTRPVTFLEALDWIKKSDEFAIREGIAAKGTLGTLATYAAWQIRRSAKRDGQWKRVVLSALKFASKAPARYGATN
jgi:hypothetical protein